MSDNKRLLKSSYEYMNRLNLVFYFLIGIPLTLFCVIYLGFEKRGGLHNTTAGSYDPLLHLILPLLMAFGLIAAYISHRRQQKKVVPQAALQHKMQVFYHLSVARYGLLLAASLLPVIGLYLTGEKLFAGLYAIALVFFSISRPTLRRFIKDLKLDKEQQERFVHSHNLNEP